MIDFIKQAADLSSNPYAMSEAMLRRLSKLLERHIPTSILEIGTGCSTIVVADYCKRHNAKFASYDCEEPYRKQTVSWMAKTGLEAYTHCVRLCRVIHDKSEHIFVLEMPDLQVDINFVIIDGPSNITHGRRGVMRSIWQFLDKRCLILIDDFHLSKTQRDLKFWQSQFPSLGQVDTFKFGRRKMILCEKSTDVK